MRRMQAMWRWLGAIPRTAFFGVMFAGSALITASSLTYFEADVLPAFMVEKLPLRFEELWLGSLRLHVVAAALSFPLCLALMTRVLQRHPRWHRRLGRVAGTLMLFLLVPSGAVLALDAKGGPLVTAGFLLSGAIVAWGTVAGVLAARRRELGAHARAMRHVVAQMSVAVTSRAMMVAFDEAGMQPELAYVIALWVPVLGSALSAELVSRKPSLGLAVFVQSLQRSYREISPPAVLVFARAHRRPVARRR